MRFAALLAVLCVTPLLAQDQTVIVAGTFRPLDFPPGSPVLTNAILSPDDAETAIRTIFGDNYDRDTYYILHALRYLTGSDSGKPGQQHWYVYYSRWRERKCRILDPRMAKHFEELRLFGAAKVAMVYVHIVNGTTRAEAEVDALARKAVPARGAGESDPAYLARLQALIVAENNTRTPAPTLTPVTTITDAQAQLSQVRSAILKAKLDFLYSVPGAENPNFALRGVTGVTLAHSFGVLMENRQAVAVQQVYYQINITKVTPAPIQNLQGILGLAVGANSATTDFVIGTRPMALVAGGAFVVSHLPSKMEITAISQQDENKSTELGKNTFDNEKKYWYDFSLAAPLNTYNELRYSQTNNQLTAKTIDKKNLVAFFNFGVPRDTKHLEAQYIPVFLYGIPITGQPLRHHFFAASVGLNRVNVFFGTRLDKKAFYTDFTKPLTGDNVTQKWRTHFTWGINFPVSTVTEALKKKASSK